MADSAIEWLRMRFERDIQFATWNRNVTEVHSYEDDGYNPNRAARIWVDTATNRFTIKAHSKEEEDHTYLGCIAQSKRWRAGEDWHRGNDLPDGEMTDETWWRILGAIVGYELQDKNTDPGYKLQDT